MKGEIMMTEEFSKDTILSILDDAISNDVGNNFANPFNNTFNSDPYIIGTYKANQALNSYQGAWLDGTFGAINDTKDYFNELGIVNDNQQHLDPEKLASLLAYCMGDYYFTELLADLNVDEDKTITETLAQKAHQLIIEMNADPNIDFVRYIHDLNDNA